MRPATRTVIIAALLAAVAIPLHGQEESASRKQALELVQKMIAAYGGMERWNSVRSVSFTLRNFAYGLGQGKPVVSKTDQWFTKDPRPMLRIDLPLGKQVHTKVFDGLEAWMAIDEKLIHKGQQVYGRIRATAKNTMLWAAFPYNLVLPGTRIDYLGEKQVLGMDTYVLQVSWNTTHAVNPDDIYRFYVSKLTHLMIREVFFLHGESENFVETLYGDYRAVNGLVKDHLRTIVASADGRQLQRIEIENLRFASAAQPELFRKPRDPMLDATPYD